MKKLLLSLAVIAASGAYIAQNRDGASLPDIGPASASLAAPASKPRIAPASLTAAPATAALVPATAVARIASAASATAQPMPPALVASVAAPLPVPTPVPTPPPAPVPAATAAIDVAQILAAQPTPAANTLVVTPVVPLPPIPRPRPADAPAAAVIVPASTQVAQTQGRYRDGSFKGTSENAYYGRVQVKIVVKGGQIAAVDVLQYPNDRRTSRYINGQALPMLEQEVIQAQSGNIDTISGATLTSGAYLQSLASALAAAAGGNNA